MSTYSQYGLVGVGSNVRFGKKGAFIDAATDGSRISFQFSGTNYLSVTSTGSVICNSAAIATNSTDGFLYLPTMAGSPSGTPTSFTGRAPIVWDSTNSALRIYSGGSWSTISSGGGGSGTVTSVSVVTANGVSGSVATSTTTPAITLTLGAITPSSVAASGTVTGSNLSGTNTGDQTITLTGDITGSGTGSFATTLATVNSSPQSNTFRKLTVNGKGLVTSTSAVSASDITTALTYTPVNQAGDTMTGLLTLSADPTSALHAATKQYVDNVAFGLNAHASVVASTTAALAACTYNNGTSGVGATLTANSNGAIGTVGGYASVSVNDRLLVKDQAATLQNGIYVVTSIGSGGTPWVFTRSSDFDNSPVGEVTAGAFTYVQQGTLAGTQWVQTTANTITVGTTSIVFTQLAGQNQYTPGTGISITSNQIANTGVLSTAAGSNINVSASTGAVTISISGQIPILNGGTGQSTASAGFNALSPITTTGDIIYGSATNTSSRLGIGSTGNVLTVSGGLPVWSAPGAAAASALTGNTLASGVTASSLTSLGTLTGLTTSGNITFSSTAQRIIADMSNATASNRLAFQTSTTNGNTALHFLPNGTGTTTQLLIETDSAVTNGAIGQLVINTTAFSILSNQRGTGSFIPMTFFVGGSERMRMDTLGNFIIGTAALSGSATDGFLYIPTAPAPSGTPTSYTGRVPVIWDSTNSILKIYSGGSWGSVGGGSGTVTSVSVVSANGFTGSVATNTTTPAITLTTSITGVLKGNGTAISSATSGTDYSAGTSALTTGILKSTTSTGALTIAVAADFPTLNQNTTGSAATLTTPRAINGVNFDGSAAITVTAAAGTLTGTTLNSTVVSSSLTSVGTLTGLTTSGNLSFSSTSQRITGDFTNATLVNRLMFQTTTTNGQTNVGLIPLGTSTTSVMSCYNAADPTNSANSTLFSTSTTVGINSGNNGTGTLLPLTLTMGGTEKVRLDTSGNFIIGTAALSGSATDGFLYIPTAPAPSGTPTSYTGRIPMVWDSTNSALKLYTGGSWTSVGGGGGGGATITPTTSSSTFYPTFVSTTSGTMSVANIDNTLNLTYVPSTGSLSAANYITTSDIRTKENIKPINNALATILKLTGKEFNFIGNPKSTFGFIAQEVKEVLPNIVNEDEKGMLAVNYQAIIAQLVESIKTLEGRIKYLENK